MNKTIFLGRFYTPAQLVTIKEDSMGFAGLSNHNFELSIFSGLKANLDNDFSCITLPPNYSYPKRHKKLFTPKEIYQKDGVNIVSCSLCNLIGVNYLWGVCSVYINILKELKKTKDRNIRFIINAPVVQLLLPVYLAKLTHSKRVSSLLIIPDVPQFVSSSVGVQGGVKAKIVSLYDRFTNWLSNKVDYFVFLTESMSDLYEKKEYRVMEGLIDEGKCNEAFIASNESEIQSILYTGSLHKVYGILDLIQAFNSREFENAELWICGSGDSAEIVKQYASQNLSIKFYGLVSPEEAKRLQAKATILINPRTNDGEYTKYSFPSKTIEYLLANKPVIMHKLSGVPDEYYKYVYTPDSPTISGLADVIGRVLEMDKSERKERAEKGRKFIIQNKNSKVQIQRVLSLFKID